MVLQDADRENGIPFRLFREGIRRLTLQSGLDANALRELMTILGNTSRSGSFEDDAVTLLWKAALPHVKYVTVDISTAAYSVAGAATAESEDADSDLRNELDGLLAAIYQRGSSGGDGAAARGLSIGTDDLLALKSLGTERDEDMAQLGHATRHTIYALDPAVLARLAQEVEAESDVALTDRSLDVLLAVLFSAAGGTDVRRVFEQLVGLFDTLLVSRDFRGAAGLVDRVRMYAGDAPEGDPAASRNLTVVRQLIKICTSDQRISSLTAALNENQQAGIADFALLLASIGRDDPSVLLQMLPVLQNPQHRKFVCDVMFGIGLPPISGLQHVLRSSEWFVGRDILYLLSTSEDDGANRSILEAAQSTHPRLRAAAWACWATFPRVTRTRSSWPRCRTVMHKSARWHPETGTPRAPWPVR